MVDLPPSVDPTQVDLPARHEAEELDDGVSRDMRKRGNLDRLPSAV